jgi:hypothetical protein
MVAFGVEMKMIPVQFWGQWGLECFRRSNDDAALPSHAALLNAPVGLEKAEAAESIK